jgi:hypothetical protein
MLRMRQQQAAGLQTLGRRNISLAQAAPASLKLSFSTLEFYLSVDTD